MDLLERVQNLKIIVSYLNASQKSFTAEKVFMLTNYTFYGFQSAYLSSHQILVQHIYGNHNSRDGIFA